IPKYPSQRIMSLRFDDKRSGCEPDGPDGNSKGFSRRKNHQVKRRMPTIAPRAMIKDRRGTRRRSLPGETSKIPDDAFSCPLALNKDASAHIALRGPDLRRGQKSDVSGCVFVRYGRLCLLGPLIEVPST